MFGLLLQQIDSLEKKTIKLTIIVELNILLFVYVWLQNRKDANYISKILNKQC